MRFLVDAQLPRTLRDLLNEKGHHAIHTLDLALKNATPDGIICQISESENRVVISKDVDFLQSYIIKGVPEKLILVKTGNIRNAILLKLFAEHLDQIVETMNTHTLVEISETEIISHN